MSKQTAVQILVESMTTSDVSFYSKEIAIALQMEREQIISNYCRGFEASAEGWNGEYGLKDMCNISEEINAQQYYNATYGGQDE